MTIKVTNGNLRVPTKTATLFTEGGLVEVNQHSLNRQSAIGHVADVNEKVR